MIAEKALILTFFYGIYAFSMHKLCVDNDNLDKMFLICRHTITELQFLHLYNLPTL